MSKILKIINYNKTVLAYLNNLESGTVKQVINGEYTLSFTALIEPLKTEFLYNKQNLIEYNNDYFRVTQIEEEHNSLDMLKVYVDCEHISYDLIKEKKPTYGQTNKSVIYIMNDLLLPTQFQFLGTDVTDTLSFSTLQETDIKSLLYTVASIAKGELKYFQYTIELKKQLGQDRGTDFRFGKNLNNLKRLMNYVDNTVSYEVEVVQGAELQELGQYYLGDTIKVVDEALNIELSTRIIELETDVITGLNSRVILGQPIKDLTSSLSSSFNNAKLAKTLAISATEAANNANSKINSVVDIHGNLIANKLNGSLNTAITQISNSTCKTTFDDRGVITHDQPAESASTKAVLMTADGILIANAKNADGSWRWRTAITGNSINADSINTGTLSAININGVNITGSSVASDNAQSEIKLNNGVLSIKDKASTAQFNANYRDGLPAKIEQTQLDYFNEFKATNPNKVTNNTISLNSQNSHMGLEFGNGAVSIGNNWANISMYGGTSDWQTLYPTEYAQWQSGAYHNADEVNPPPATAQGATMVVNLATSYWQAYKYDSGLNLTLGNSRMIFNTDYFECYARCKFMDVRVAGDLRVNGTKNCTINTEKYGDLDYSAYETAEIYLGDLGESEIINGECIINLDNKFLECVNTDVPYQVFLTPYGDGRVWVAERNKTSFVVKGDNIKFAYEVKVKRKGYENIRFGAVA